VPEFPVDHIDETLQGWKASLSAQLDLGGLYSRSHIAHKFKAPFRSIHLRESVSWRAQDLLEQSVKLYHDDYLLGARILLRSAIETIATLIYLNQITRKVLAGTLDFHAFSEKTSILLLGSRDDSTPYSALNIMTVLQKCESRYPGILNIYALLSESAHLNYGGLSLGYSTIDHDNDVVVYENSGSRFFQINT